MNDILISKKSIRQIPILNEKKNLVENEMSKKTHYHTKIPSWQRRPLNPKFAIWFIAGISIMALFFGVSILFSSATIIISPKTENITFSSEIYVTKLNSKDVSELPFEILSVKQEAGDTIEATEEKEISAKASGKIIIYNNYTSASQRLINNTRFESKNGKIYRISNSVVVPGIKKVDGKNVPGSIEATVYADEAGEGYNLNLSDLAGDFKIPGFKGDPRYDSFYGLLKTNISGGFVGKQRIISDTLRKTTEDSIKAELKEELLKKLFAIKPENYLILKDGYSIDYSNLADTSVDTNKVKINIEGTLNGIIFNNQKFAKYISNDKIENYDGLPTEFNSLENFTATFSGNDSINLWKNTTLEIKLSGDAQIKWLYNKDEIKKDFAGKSESDLRSLTSKYKDTVAGIRILFKPVWTRYIPDDLKKITIKEETLLD